MKRMTLLSHDFEGAFEQLVVNYLSKKLDLDDSDIESRTYTSRFFKMAHTYVVDNEEQLGDIVLAKRYLPLTLFNRNNIRLRDKFQKQIFALSDVGIGYGSADFEEGNRLGLVGTIFPARNQTFNGFDEKGNIIPADELLRQYL